MNSENLAASLYPLVVRADHKRLERAAPADFDWTTLGGRHQGRHNLPPLHLLVEGYIGRMSDIEDAVKCASWMISKGADASQRAPDDADEFFESLRLDDDLEAAKIKVYNDGHSAISLIMEWKTEIEGNVVWEDDENLDRLLDAFTAQPLERRKMVSVDESVLQVWEGVLADEASHDLAFVCEGDVTVHAHVAVLSNTSPVLRAMLSSSFREGTERKIEVTDTPPAAVRLFLDIVYTGGTAEEMSVPIALSALDLAHRWEVTGVVGMLQRALVPLINKKTFVQIAEAAVTKSLPVLSSGCRSYAHKNRSQIDALRRATELSAAVLALIGCPEADGQQPPAKKRRSL